jgi:methionine biosynthesis protein MetW
MIIDTDMRYGYSLKRTEIFLKWVGSGKKVLDLGCYDGRDSSLFLKQNNEVHGVEILEKPARLAKSRGIKVKVFDLHKKDWPFEDNTFDCVVAGELIEHVENADTFLSNIHRILKPSGTFIVSTPNIASLGRRFLLLVGKNPFIEISTHEEINGFPAVGHVRYFTLAKLTELLNFHKLKVTEVSADCLIIGPFSSSFLAHIFPSLSWRLLVKAKKV